MSAVSRSLKKYELRDLSASSEAGGEKQVLNGFSIPEWSNNKGICFIAAADSIR
jgi:hypothetical protein